MIRASMLIGGPRTDVCVRDISSRGMMLQAAAPPPRGTYVDLDCAGHQFVGLVIWRRERRFGIQTRERINVRALAGRVSPEVLGASRGANGGPPRRELRPGAVSRTASGRMEFAVVALFAAALVVALGTTAFEALSRPLNTVADLLGH